MSETDTKQGGFVNLLKENAKAIAGFVAGLLLNAIQAVIAGQVPWPTNLKEWGQYLGTSLIAGIVVWATGNKLQPGQIIKGAEDQGITVITDTAIDVTRAAAERAVKEAVQNVPLPAGAGVVVGNIVHEVSNTVGNVLKGVADNFPGLDIKDFV